MTTTGPVFPEDVPDSDSDERARRRRDETPVPAPPLKPRFWSDRRYRETYDSTPVVVIAADNTEYLCCGAVSAHIIARTMPGSRVVADTTRRTS